MFCKTKKEEQEEKGKTALIMLFSVPAAAHIKTFNKLAATNKEICRRLDAPARARLLVLVYGRIVPKFRAKKQTAIHKNDLPVSGRNSPCSAASY